MKVLILLCFVFATFATDGQKVIMEKIYQNLMPAPSPVGSYFAVYFNPGLPVSATQYDPDHTPTAVNDFSAIMNKNLKLSSIYEDSGTTMDKLYAQVLSANLLASKPPSQEALNQYLNAMNQVWENVKYDGTKNITTFGPNHTPNYKGYLDALDGYNDALADYQTAYLNVNFKNAKEVKKWNIDKIKLQRKIAQRRDDLNSFQPGIYQNALNTISNFGKDARQTAFANANNLYNTQTQPGLFPVTANPPDFYSDDGWSSSTITSNSESFVSNSKFESYGGGASFSYGLWSAGGSFDHSSNKTHFHSDTTNISITLEYKRVTLDRSQWLDTSLFNIDGWSLQGYKKQQWSDGNLDQANTKTVWPILPTGFILVRNVEITADFSSKDRDTYATQTSSSASFGYGFFSVSGHYSSGSSEEKFTSTFDGNTIKIPGMQILGFYTSINPAFPPESPGVFELKKRLDHLSSNQKYSINIHGGSVTLQ